MGEESAEEVEEGEDEIMTEVSALFIEGGPLSFSCPGRDFRPVEGFRPSLALVDSTLTMIGRRRGVCNVLVRLFCFNHRAVRELRRVRRWLDVVLFHI